MVKGNKSSSMPRTGDSEAACFFSQLFVVTDDWFVIVIGFVICDCDCGL